MFKILLMLMAQLVERSCRAAQTNVHFFQLTKKKVSVRAIFVIVIVHQLYNFRT